MVDFIELTKTQTATGEQPVMVRKSNVVAIYGNTDSTVLIMNSGDMFHVKQSYNNIKEQFKFE